MNSTAYHKIWQEYHEGLHALAKADTPWEEWNAQILQNVLKLCHDRRGKRVVVVFGGAHAYYLLAGLAKDQTVNLVASAKFLPLTETDVTPNTDPMDYLQALGPLNLNAVSPAQLAHMKPFLDRVKDMPALEGDYHLFRGKFLLHDRKPKEALIEFELLGTRKRDELSKFDNTSRLFEMGLIHSALALYQMGDRDAARKRLENAIKDTQLTAPAREWAKQVLESLR